MEGETTPPAVVTDLLAAREGTESVYRARIAGLVVLAGLLIGIALLYAPTLNDPFHGDDFVAFTEFKTKGFWDYSRDVFLFEDSNFYWRPLGKVAHCLLYQIFGLDAMAFRAFGLFVFLSTVACLYFFCLRARLGQLTALGAVALFGLMPNHVVSVAWVTNTSRLMAVLFFMLCLLLLQRRGSFEWLVELGALLCFVAAGLSDEVALGLAPLPFFYAVLVRDERLHKCATLIRFAMYSLPAALLVPLTLRETLHDEPRLAFYSFGSHILDHFWALVGQLVLPLTPAAPVDVILMQMPPAQWAAGAIAIAAGVLLLFVGSRMTRFLVVWTALALGPFSLWDLGYTSPRYVYMAGVPFAILSAWLFSLAVARLPQLTGRASVVRQATTLASLTGVAAVLMAGALVSGETVRDRNADWSTETEGYGQLASGLEERLPDPPAGARIFIFYGPWPDFWATSLAQTLYGDPSIKVVDIPAERVDLPLPPFRRTDYVFYYVNERLIVGGLTGAASGSANGASSP